MDNRESTIYKGIGILLMVIHHSFGFPAYYISTVRYDSFAPYADFFGRCTNICVPIFAFITGVGLAYTVHKYGRLQDVLKRIFRFILAYWKVYALILCLAVALCGYRPTVQELILQTTARESKMMIFCWYVMFYITACLFSWFMFKVFKMLNVRTWYTEFAVAGIVCGGAGN